MEEAEVGRLIDWTLKSFRRDPDWDDIRQEAWLWAWRVLTGKRPPCAESTMVQRAARWAALTWLRRRRKQREILVPDLEEQFSFEQCLDLAALAPVHARVRANVTSRYWEVFTAYYQGGLTHAELARREGVGTSRICQMISMVRNRYRRELGLPERGYGPAKIAARNHQRLDEPEFRAKRRARQRVAWQRARERQETR